MIKHKHWLMTGAAVVAALGLGFGAARLTEGPAAEAPHEEEGHDEGESAEGLVALTEREAMRLGIELTAPRAGGGGELKLPGRVHAAPGAEASVDAPLPGVVTAVRVGVGDPVRVGTPLAIVRSPEGAAGRADVDAAAATVDAARAAESRDRTLFQQGWVSKARLDATAAEARRAEAQLRAARARVGAYGGPGPDGLVAVRSPIAGVVTRVSVAPGQVLHEEALQVAAVSDAGRVELVFEAPPSAASLLAVGAPVTADLPGGGSMTGSVIAVAPANEQGVVVIRARAAGAPPPLGTVVSARLSAGGGGGGLTVPLDAVQTVDGVPSVFVLTPQGFRATPVVTGAVAAGRIEIVTGLTGAERIAGRNAFLLKAELSKSEAEHGH
ncbi:MAG TPA: efflux RND transporter periplasmic adaptor subunit [Brevundimonas sp.]|jgi:cobalt-zinc-cadmium efflux system membrane fusion protein|uniref:efflux RND transporter periplasmic adaptor subunit n=1 Tax=Brevundimonas sp. TaxID=1871086 RepID=UPI002DE69436|nr:efflux RND transporter periplasmic adaptor subunit [Brevundimonas sp.]